MSEENISEDGNGAQMEAQAQGEEQPLCCWKNGKIVPLSADERAEHALREADWQAQAPARKAQEVRSERNKLLKTSDLIFLRAVENNIDLAAIKAYRQALRDVTSQPNFPDSVQWPTIPSHAPQAHTQGGNDGE
jgi:hypothetical protein